MSAISELLEKSKEFVSNGIEIIGRHIENLDNVIDQALSNDQYNLADNPEKLAIAQSIFGDSINYGEVKINESSATSQLNGPFNQNGPREFVWLNTINSTEPLSNEEFVHELTHVWQYQTQGLGYLTGRGGYDYTHADLERISNDPDLEGNRFAQFGGEQQGEIIKDYYKLISLEDGDSTTLTTGEKVDHNNVSKYLDIYQPYIEEVQAAEAIEGAHKEFNEGIEESTRELGELGEEVTREVDEAYREVSNAFSNGTPVDVARETVEGSLETGREFVEGGLETGKEIVEGGLETGREIAEDLGSTVVEGAETLGDKAGDVIDTVGGWIPGR